MNVDHPARILQYNVHAYPVTVGPYSLRLLGPADPDAILDDPETERRFYAENEFMPYWARPWAASRILAEFICNRPRGAGRPALELGAGLGMVGLVAAMHGWNVTLTDYEEAALAFAKATAELNGISQVTFQKLDWHIAQSFARPFDLIIGADILFESRWVEPIVRLIAHNIGHATALICDPNRRTAESFAETAEAQGLTVQRHAVSTTDFDGAGTQGTIYEIRKRSR